MIQLRDYQKNLVDGVQAALYSEKARVMMQLPTGGGKTVIAGALLNAFLKDGRKAVWLTHRKELAAQTRDLLVNTNVAASVDVRWNPGEDAPARQNGVTILMAQTVSRRTARANVWPKYDADDLMIIDEAHHASADGWTRAMQQWPGRILGMTATPWRLSHKEGFDHLFDALLCGPAVVDLQSGNHLSGAQVLRPSSQWIIRGGAVGMDGDFTDSGIVAANQDHIMTAGALKFWQEHAQDRQTIVYAVSVDHAHNLEAVFRDGGVPAGVMLGETGDEERARLITAFRRGNLRVLVNVAVATEGFDLPDASCVVITRPTKSLTLYLQMVGRGLRPKENNGNCLILDLAANAEVHGLPEDDREWSLKPRAVQEEVGDAVTVWCDSCNSISPAASHACQTCGEPFGKECSRCGTWRAWKRWSLEKQCGDAHEFVCDLCHRDAHIEAKLPISEPLESALAELEGKEEEMLSTRHVESEPDLINQSLGQYQDFLAVLEGEFGVSLANDLEAIQHHEDFYEMGLKDLESRYGPYLADCLGRWNLYWILRRFLEGERTKVMGPEEERQRKLRKAIEERESKLADDAHLESMFGEFISNLPVDKTPQSKPQEYRMFNEWEDNQRKEMLSWQSELALLENKPIDRSLVFEGARDRVMDLLRQAAQDVNLLPGANDEATPIASQKNTRGKRSSNGSSQSDKRPYGASKSTATHPEQLKKLALRLSRAGNNARQVAEELFNRDFGTREGRMIGAGQMAQMLKRWSAEPNPGETRRTRKPRRMGSRAGKQIAQAKAKAHRLREQGLTMAKIAGKLNDEGYRTVKGYPYTQQNVWHLLNRDK